MWTFWIETLSAEFSVAQGHQGVLVVQTCHLLHAVCSLSVSGTVAVLSRNALTLQFLATATQSRGVKARRHTVHHITPS